MLKSLFMLFRSPPHVHSWEHVGVRNGREVLWCPCGCVSYKFVSGETSLNIVAKIPVKRLVNSFLKMFGNSVGNYINRGNYGTRFDAVGA